MSERATSTVRNKEEGEGVRQRRQVFVGFFFQFFVTSLFEFFSFLPIYFLFSSVILLKLPGLSFSSPLLTSPPASFSSINASLL